jgi:tetratricopeptide (TPR) repeat protein
LALVDLRKALAIYRELMRENHYNTANIYEAVGNALCLHGRCDDALIGYGRALAIRRKFFGKEPIYTAHSYYIFDRNALSPDNPITVAR